MSKLLLQLDDLTAKITYKDTIKSSVSNANVGWHIDHSLKVINSMITVLKKSNPNDYRSKFNLKQYFFLLRGTIPRGKAEAPKYVRSYESISEKDIERQLATARFLINELQTIPKNSNVKHPYIGVLNVKKSIRFLEIHTQHHLKIMNEIIK